MIQVNSLILLHDDDGKAHIERVLWIGSNGVDCVTIDIHANNLPTFKRYADLQTNLENGVIQKVYADEFDWVYSVDEKSLTQARRVRRDQAYEIVKNIVFTETGEISLDAFHPGKRGELISQAADKYYVDVKTIREYLKRFWMRGCHKNALLFNFQYSGRAERFSARHKLGRPNETMVTTGLPHGIIITKKVAGYFKAAIDKYLGKMPLSKIFIVVLNEHFSSGEDENGNPVHLPVANQPTLKQFYYFWGKLKEADPEKYAKLRQGRYGYLHAGRPTTGDSSASVYGPGQVYQIDASPLGIAACSAINLAWVIGMLILYVVTDVFSHMVVGFYLGYGTAWLDAVLAIECAFQNKVKFCEKHGITISQQDWDVEGKCKLFVTDGGSEWTSYFSDSLQNIGVGMAQPEAYRPELKGLVESLIKALKTELKLPDTPGANIHNKRSEPGIEDPYITAALTRNEITQILTYIIKTRNSTTEIVDYSRDKHMVAANIPKIPLALWKWGIENRSGTLSEITEDTLRSNLWPKAKASITGNGITFKGKKYKAAADAASEQEVDEKMRNLFIKARKNGAEEPVASYHPDFPNDIYLKFGDNDVVHCQLDKQDSSFSDIDWYEIENADAQYRLGEPERRAKRNQARGAMQSETERIVKNAKARAKQARRGLTKTQQRSNINENRRRERAQERASNAGVTDSNAPILDETGAPTKFEGYVGLPALEWGDNDEED